MYDFDIYTATISRFPLFTITVPNVYLLLRFSELATVHAFSLRCIPFIWAPSGGGRRHALGASKVFGLCSFQIIFILRALGYGGHRWIPELFRLGGI
jgi:hypothetical protein